MYFSNLILLLSQQKMLTNMIHTSILFIQLNAPLD